ncbi:jacalin-like lectin [Clostridioides difficile]
MTDLNLRKTNLIDAKASRAVDFDDFREYEELRCTFPNEIFIRYGEAIDLIGTCYAQFDLNTHGTYRGNEAHLEFLTGEHIIKITGTIASYWNKSFIFNLTFHTDMGRDVGMENQQNGRTVQGKPFTIEFDKGYALACLFGKTSSPIERGKTLHNYSFLSAIGAYQRKIGCITQAEFTKE